MRRASGCLSAFTRRREASCNCYRERLPINSSWIAAENLLESSRAFNFELRGDVNKFLGLKSP